MHFCVNELFMKLNHRRKRRFEVLKVAHFSFCLMNQVSEHRTSNIEISFQKMSLLC